MGEGRRDGYRRDSPSHRPTVVSVWWIAFVKSHSGTVAGLRYNDFHRAVRQLPNENSSQPNSKDLKIVVGLLRPVLVVEDVSGRHITVNQAAS
jgi:hypothetical protein